MAVRDGAPDWRSLRIPLALFGLCLAAQLYLLFFKSFNWDEFIHFTMVHQLRAGTLHEPFQVFHLRLIGWAPEVAANLVDQMRAARLWMWGMNLVTLAMIFGIARRFVPTADAFLAAFAYLGAGYVFTQGFSIRADPFATAALMSGLYLVSRAPLRWPAVALAGGLVGLAGMMTFKSAFYAPCFAGLLWLHLRESENPRAVVVKAGGLLLSAMAAFAGLYALHTAGFPSVTNSDQSPAFFLRWVSQGTPFVGYVGRAIVLAPLFLIALVLTPRAIAKAGLDGPRKVALAGFVAPLLVLFFYRNTFPYFFVFLLAPVAVAIAPALAELRKRFGATFLALALAISPLALAAREPVDVLDRQRALIDYVHAEFPRGTTYLDYSGMVADYPRVLRYLTSGNGMDLYHRQGIPLIGQASDAGRLPFIIANQENIARALVGRPAPQTFLPQDLAAMRGYARQWGVLWREGQAIPAGGAPFPFDLRRGGSFVLAAGTLTIDGRPVAAGAPILLAPGRHVAEGARGAPTTLWRGTRLPGPHPRIAIEEVFTNY